MKRFTSRMDALRRVRQQAEQLAKTTAAQHQARKAAADREVTRMQQHVLNVQSHVGIVLGSGISGSLLQTLLARAAHSRQQLATAESAQVDADRSLQQAIMEYGSARSERQIIDKFVIHQQAEHRRQQQIAQDHTASELASQRFHRTNKGLTDTQAQAQEAQS